MTSVNEVCNWCLLKIIEGKHEKKVKIFPVLIVNEIISFPDDFIFRKNNNENVPIIKW